jgi:GNAT superfamily N-acetyltransferase
MPAAEATVRRLGEPGDLGWVVMANAELYAKEYGWDASYETLVIKIIGDYAATHDDTREAGWIAEVDGRRAGCVFCVAADADTAQLRLLLVEPSARGHGLGTRLVDECLTFAKNTGYKRMKLWTNHPLAAARKIYLSRGFTRTEEEPHHSWGADLIGQIYELKL